MFFKKAVPSIATRLFAAVLAVCAFAGVALAQTSFIKPSLQTVTTPLAFEPNMGQSDATTRYVAHGLEYNLELQPNEARMLLRSGSRNHAQSAVLGMKIDGARSIADGFGLDKMPGHSNYFIGSDRSKWLTGVPNYGKVRFNQVYDGIDLVYYGTDGKLEYDFIVAPGVDPSPVRLTFYGAQSLSLVDGNLQIATTAGDIRLIKPTVYQEIGGKRQTIESSYVVDDNHVGFKIAKYDTTMPLVIDPTLTYTVISSSGAFEFAESVALDANGNVYTAGTELGGNAFLTKSGVSPYRTTFGGNDNDYGLDVAVVQSGIEAGKVFVTGLTYSTNFPAGGGLLPQMDGFLVKLGTTGAIEFSKRIGSLLGDDQANSVALKPTGTDTYDIFVAGATKTPLTGLLGILPSNWTGYVAKIDASGNIQTGTYIGPVDVRVDTTENPARSMKISAGSGVNEIYVAGTTSGSFLCPTSVTCTPASTPGGIKAFAMKMDGAAFSNSSYITWIAGSQDVQGNSIVASGGAAYLAGATQGTLACVGYSPACSAGTYGSPVGQGDALVVKLDSTGKPAKYIYLGGDQTDNAFDIAVQGSNVVVTGETFNPSNSSSPEFPTLNAAKALRGTDGREAFISKLDSNLTLTSSTFVGSSVGDTGKGIAATSSKVVVAGWNDNVKAFVSVLDDAGISILSLSLDKCYDLAHACRVSVLDLNTTIATVTVTLSGPLGSNTLQVVDGLTHIIIGSRSPTTTTGSVYTFPVTLISVPGAGETIGAVIDANFNSVTQASQPITLKGPGGLTGLAFSANPAPANSPLAITIAFDEQPAPKLRITKSSTTPNSANYLSFGGSATTLQMTIPSGTTSVVFNVNTLNPATPQAVRIKAELLDANNNPTGVFLESSPDLTINPHVFKLPSVNGLTLSTATVKGGTGLTGVIHLDCPAGVTPPAPQTVSLMTNAPDFVGVPTSVTVATGACNSAPFPITTKGVSVATPVTVTAELNGSLADAIVTVNPPKLTAFSLNPTTVNGGQASTGTLTFDGPTPDNGIAVNISSNNDAVVTYPSNVTITDTTASTYSGTFSIQNNSPAAGASVVFTASLNGDQPTAPLTIRPATSFVVSAVNLTATAVTGGTSFGSNTVSLTCPSGQTPTTALTVALSSNNAGVTLSPTSVTVPVGSCTSGAFTVNTSAVASATPVVITATLGASTANRSFTVNPPKVTALSLNPTTVNGAQASTGTITLDGPTPAGGITVAISSNNNAVVTYSPTVVVTDTTSPYEGTFTIGNTSPTTNQTVVFTASLNGTAQATLNIRGSGGGGFIPYSKFEVEVAVDLNRGEDDDNFWLDGDFTLGTLTDGINPTTEDLTLRVGTYSVTIPKGSFKRQGDWDEDGDDDRRKPKEVWHFYGKIGNDRIHIHIHGYGSNQYNIRARVHRVDMTGVVNGTPIEVFLQVGNDAGTAVDTNPKVKPRIFDLKDLVLTPRTVLGSNPSMGTVSLKCSYGVQPAAPVTISLSAEAGTGVTVPATVTIPAGPSCSATFPITTTAVSRTTSVTIKATFGSTNDWAGWWGNWTDWKGWFKNWQNSSETATLTVQPIQFDDLDLSARAVIGGSSSTGTISLQCDDDVRPTVAVTVALTAEAGTGVSVPASVTIPVGSCQATFPIATTTVTRQVSATITATFGQERETAELSVSSIQLKDVDLASSSIEGGKSTTGTVELYCSGLSLPSPVTVALSAEAGTGVSVPASVTVPAGSACSVSFPITTTVTTKTVTARITATLGSDQEYSTLTIKKK